MLLCEVIGEVKRSGFGRPDDVGTKVHYDCRRQTIVNDKAALIFTRLKAKTDVLVNLESKLLLDHSHRFYAERLNPL